jgi:hypothetical protein
MKTDEAVRICQEWFAHIEHGRRRSVEIQKLASMARNGQADEARRRLRQIDNTPTVYDGDRLEPAVRHLVELASRVRTGG